MGDGGSLKSHCFLTLNDSSLYLITPVKNVNYIHESIYTMSLSLLLCLGELWLGCHC